MQQPRRGGCNGCTVGCLLALLILLALGFGGFVWADQNGWLSGSLTRSATPPPVSAPAVATATALVVTDPALEQGQGQNLDEVRELVASGQSNQPFTLVVTQEQLTDEVRKQLDQRSDLPFSDPVVGLQPGPDGVTIQGRVHLSNLEPVVTMRGNLAVTPDGMVTYNIVKIDFGGLPVPDAAREQITTKIKQTVEEYFSPSRQKLAVNITSIHVLIGRAVIEGTTK